MNVLLVHATPLDRLGGAELSLSEHLRRAPDGVRVDVVLPDADPDLERYDAVVLANLRPAGGVGEEAEMAPAIAWTDRLAAYEGFSLKSERDLHPCTLRDARCVAGPDLRFVGCGCSTKMRKVFEGLYNACSAVQFLSPGHEHVIRTLVEVRTRCHLVAPPVDLEAFRVERPPEEREPIALILGDATRVAPSADERARRAGYEPERVPYLSVPHDQMPRLYNRYRAVVVDPIMFHAFGRIVVEALACGCEVLASERVGALSWPDPRAACRRANEDFWSIVLDGGRARSSTRPVRSVARDVAARCR